MRPIAFPSRHASLRFLPVALCAMLGLGGCAATHSLPFADDSAAQAAPYPALIPLGPVVAQAQAGQSAPDGAADVAARLAALNARADALRGPVVPDATSARLANAVR